MEKIYFLFTVLLWAILAPGCQQNTRQHYKHDMEVSDIFNRVRAHDFNPLSDDQSMTKDRQLGEDGIADLENDDWSVRLLAVRDLVKIGASNTSGLLIGLRDSSMHVRYICAMALGILNAKEAVPDLENVLRQDEVTVVRSQAAFALGQIESMQSLGLLKQVLLNDPSKDVRHQCELAIYQIEHHSGVTDKLLRAYQDLDESSFETVKVGDMAPDFALEDTEGVTWRLSDFRDKQWVVLVWVFADWCPVCHGEFHDLMEMEAEFKNTGIQVFTLETHDTYRGRVMVGKELEPEYWFSKTSFKDAYTNKIFWPHLLDRAGAVGARYGIDPLAFAVHAEYINRPATIIIDPNGKVRFSYIGTFWGDRPSIGETLNMIRTQNFTFEHPKRRKTGQ